MADHIHRPGRRAATGDANTGGRRTGEDPLDVIELKPGPDYKSDWDPPGPTSKDMLRVVVREEALEVIDSHVVEDTRVECGGVLVGTVSGTVVQVRGAIPARQAVGAVTSLTFTHEAWDEVTGQIEADWPDMKMVGWYHSHPGFGIFLSEHDQFIQSNFFSELWQVAYVSDPLLRRSGMFGWQDGKIMRHTKWAIMVPGSSEPVNEPVRPDPAPGAPLSQAFPQQTVPPPLRRWPALAAAALAVPAFIVGYFVHPSQAAPAPLVFNSGPVTGTPARAGVNFLDLVTPSSGGILSWKTEVTNNSGTDLGPAILDNCAPSTLTPEQPKLTLPQSSEQGIWHACRLGVLAPGARTMFLFSGPSPPGRGLGAWGSASLSYELKRPTESSSSKARRPTTSATSPVSSKSSTSGSSTAGTATSLPGADASGTGNSETVG